MKSKPTLFTFLIHLNDSSVHKIYIKFVFRIINETCPASETLMSSVSAPLATPIFTSQSILNRWAQVLPYLFYFSKRRSLRNTSDYCRMQRDFTKRYVGVSYKLITGVLICFRCVLSTTTKKKKRCAQMCLCLITLANELLTSFSSRQSGFLSDAQNIKLFQFTKQLSYCQRRCASVIGCRWRHTPDARADSHILQAC